VSRWITRVERTLTEDVPGSPNDVRAFYSDLNNIKLVHPLVVSVRTVDRRETADGYVHTYRIGDLIPLGPLRLRTNYTARLHVPVTGDVLSEARQFPRVRLCSTVAFEPVGAGTRVVERIRIEAPRPLAAVTTRKAVEAHIEMLAGIRRHFDRAPN
jgi:polyketide cyclase/dehydrase/lipid transport protein